MVFREADSRYDCCFGIDPRPLGINMATYTGFQHSGVIGSIAATFGLVLPSVIIIILISKVLEKFRSNKYVEYAFYGLRPAVMGLIAAAGFGVLIGGAVSFCGAICLTLSNFGSYIGIEECILFVVLLSQLNKWKKHPIFYIVLSAIVGIVFAL